MGRSDVAVQLSQWRRHFGLTQAQLEEKAGLGHNTVSRIERGENRPQFGSLDKLAKAMGISTEQLLVGTPPAGKVIVPEEPFRSRMIAETEKLEEEICRAIYPIWEKLLEFVKRSR